MGTYDKYWEMTEAETEDKEGRKETKRIDKICI